jgi:hypothetical protein
LSSDNECTAAAITLERVIEACGSFGRYQRVHLVFLLLFPIASGVFNYYYIFGAAETPYACLPPRDLAPDVTAVVSATQCSYVEVLHNQTVGAYACSDWTYDRRVFGKTFAEEANLVCQHSIHRSFLSTALQLGAMFMFFTGQITDRIGRRRSLHLLIALLLITSMITQTLLQFVPMSIHQK